MANIANLTVSGFRELFLDDTPMMDVRAPVEFAAGAFPAATSLPLLDDAQRHEIGCVYAENGQQAAITRGKELASPAVRAKRMDAWLQHINCHPNGYLYCFRGGLRSHIAQQWLQEAGVEYPLVQGGYKSVS